jgi:MerR family transcriptional regulator, light-induced transcriptional regulator
MQRESPGASVAPAAPDCEDDPVGLQLQAGAPVFSSLVARNNAAKERLAHLARTIEADVIPRLVQAHRHTAPAANHPEAGAATQTPDQVAGFVALIVGDSDLDVQAVVDSKRRAGLSVESLYLDLFAPAARLLGEMWSDDACDFSTVTVALGRLQRLLRELSPAFGTEVDYPANGRRAMFAQPSDEQHSFGLSMVAEFFRRDGWDVFGVVGGTGEDPAVRARREWADVVGLSIGSERRLDWLRKCITDLRAASRNPGVVVMVGGPIFTLHPDWAASVGADATARDAREAPRVASRLLVATRVRR